MSEPLPDMPPGPTAAHTPPPIELLVRQALSEHWAMRYDVEHGAYCECGVQVGGENLSMRDHMIVEIVDALNESPLPERQPVSDGDVPLGFE